MGSKQEAFTEAVNRTCPEALPTLDRIVKQLEAGTAQRIGVGGCQGCADNLMGDAAEVIKKMAAALKVARDCVMESFDHVHCLDDQILADARLRDIDAALSAGHQ